jgi:hypothetical protein
MPTRRIIALILLLTLAPAVRAQPSSAEIEQALKRAKAYLYSIQANGHWDLPQRAPPARPNARGEFILTEIQNSSQWGGISALATYALLAAGDSPQDAKVAAAIDFLKKAEINGTYALGVRLQVWNSMPAALRKQTLEFAKRDRDQLLLKNKRTDDRTRPFFRYLPDETDSDHSASQFAVLGLWAAEQCGAEVPTAFWKETETAWLKDQNAASGGWSYSNTFNRAMDITVSMTAAGVATLFITNDYLHGPASADCRGNAPHKAIDAGLAYLTAHAAEVFEMKSDFPFYTLYGIERIGLASGYKYLGPTDWYKQGAEAILASQGADGSWGSVADTCFAVLFLVRGRAPLVLNKLEYALDAHGDKTKPANWNQRPRDAANLTRWMGRQLERDLRWQIVPLKGPAEDLHDAPILYLAGNQPLAFTAEEEEKLRQFALQGGVILGNADCAGPLFATSFKKLGAKLFPPYEFRELPAAHLLFEQNYSRKNWRNPPQVQGLSNGARELMILLPTADPARFWQTGAIAGHEPAYEFLANLFLYATEHRELRTKGEPWIIAPHPNLTPPKSLRLARLKHEGNWNPEPAGWPRLAAMLHNENQVELTIDTIKLGDGKLTAPAKEAAPGQGGYALAHLTTTGKFKLTDAQRAELKAYVAAGGTLLVDAAGGDGDAAANLETELTSLTGNKPATLALDDPLYKNLGLPAADIAYRPYAMKRTLGQIKGPRLRAALINNRPAIYFSPEDLSTALVGQPIDGIFGYTPQSAAAICRAIVLTAAK